ncbi:hypothetical protein ONZ45_g8796 [Pleurotus djamor]|nr:hypothetical protein ONZ45_g8796 [Pleurotus djamor]
MEKPKPKPKRRKVEDIIAAEKARPKAQKADSTAARVKPEPKARKRSTKHDVESADDTKPPTKRTRKKLDEDPSEQPQKRPKASRVTTLADIPEEDVEPPDLPAQRSAPSTSSILPSKRKGKAKASQSVPTEAPKLESVVQIAPPKPKRGKVKAKAVGSPPVGEDARPADTAPSTFKKGKGLKSTSNEDSNSIQADDQVAPSTSRKGKAKAVTKSIVDPLDNDAPNAAGTKPKTSTKKRQTKQETSHFPDVQASRNDDLAKDVTPNVGSPPPRGNPKSKKRKQDSIPEEPLIPRKRLKKQADTVDECNSSEEKPTRKAPSSQQLKENSATKPPRITSKYKVRSPNYLRVPLVIPALR